MVPLDVDGVEILILFTKSSATKCVILLSSTRTDPCGKDAANKIVEIRIVKLLQNKMQKKRKYFIRMSKHMAYID